MLTGNATEKQRTWLLALLKKNKSHPDLPQWWAELKPYWVVKELAPGVHEGSFSENLPKQLASEMIDKIKNAGSNAAKPKFDTEKWHARVDTYWVDPATSNIVWVRFSEKSQRPYGKVAEPGATKFVYAAGLLRADLVPLTADEFRRVAELHEGRCPICRKEFSGEPEDIERHLKNHASHIVHTSVASQ